MPHLPRFHMAQRRRQVVALLQRTMSIVSAGRLHRQLPLPPHQIIVLPDTGWPARCVFTPATRIPFTSRSCAVPKFLSTRPLACGECAAIQAIPSSRKARPICVGGISTGSFSTPGSSRLRFSLSGTGSPCRCRIPAAGRTSPGNSTAASCSLRSNRAARSARTTGWWHRRSSRSGTTSRPRPSSQSCSLVSHCTSSPNRLRRGRQTCTCLIFSFLPRHSLAPHHPFPHRLFARLDPMLACPDTPPPTSVRTLRTPAPTGSSPPAARCFFDPPVGRLSAQPVDHGLIAALLQRLQQPLHLPYAQPQFLGSLRCVISLFFAFFNVTSRSLSAWVISSCPSCIPKAWGCQDDISTLLKRRHSHFAATAAIRLSRRRKHIAAI